MGEGDLPPGSPGPPGRILAGGAVVAGMARERFPVTPASRVLKAAGLEVTHHLYEYVEKGGTASSSRALGVPEHEVVKTLVMEDEGGHPFLVLMHGDREVSTRELARQLGVRSVQPCRPEVAERHTGYQVGGTSPFGTRKPLPVYVEETVLGLARLYVNGGKRGYLVGMPPGDLARVLSPTPVSVAVPRS